jgi:hypothetical protein
MPSGLRVKCPLLSDLNETWGFSTVFEKYAKTKFRENPSSGSRVVPCGQTDGQTDMTKLIAASRNIANALNNPLRFSGNIYVVPLHLHTTYDVGDATPEHTIYGESSAKNVSCNIMKRFRIKPTLSADTNDV